MSKNPDCNLKNSVFKTHEFIHSHINNYTQKNCNQITQKPNTQNPKHTHTHNHSHNKPTHLHTHTQASPMSAKGTLHTQKQTGFSTLHTHTLTNEGRIRTYSTWQLNQPPLPPPLTHTTPHYPQVMEPLTMIGGMAAAGGVALMNQGGCGLTGLS